MDAISPRKSLDRWCYGFFLVCCSCKFGVTGPVRFANRFVYPTGGWVLVRRQSAKDSLSSVHCNADQFGWICLIVQVLSFPAWEARASFLSEKCALLEAQEESGPKDGHRPGEEHPCVHAHRSDTIHEVGRSSVAQRWRHAVTASAKDDFPRRKNGSHLAPSSEPQACRAHKYIRRNVLRVLESR